MTNNNETKRCTFCHTTLNVSKFYRDAASKDGFTSRCKLCWRVLKRRTRASQRELNTAVEVRPVEPVKAEQPESLKARQTESEALAEHFYTLLLELADVSGDLFRKALAKERVTR